MNDIFRECRQAGFFTLAHADTAKTTYQEFMGSAEAARSYRQAGLCGD